MSLIPCPFCDGEGKIGTLICDECKGRRMIPEERMQGQEIPKTVLEKHPADPINPQDLIEPPKPIVVQPQRPAGVPNLPPMHQQESEYKILFKIFLELISKIRGDSNKKVIVDVFKRFVKLEG